jgi:hypothetical protein
MKLTRWMKTIFNRRPVKQCRNSSRGSGTQGGGGTVSQRNGKTRLKPS